MGPLISQLALRIPGAGKKHNPVTLEVSRPPSILLRGKKNQSSFPILPVAPAAPASHHPLLPLRRAPPLPPGAADGHPSPPHLAAVAAQLRPPRHHRSIYYGVARI
ncbi:unnamed protein product [Urochloa humidicola]